MARKILTILLSVLALFSVARATEPDFAFPQTVKHDAQVQLEQAVKAQHSVDAVEALLQYAIADVIVDRDSTANVLTKICDTRNRLDSPTAKSVLFVLQAQMLNTIYQSERYKYDRRQLPLEPRPHDIFEWSGEQFKTQVAALCDSAMSYSDYLFKTPLGEYKGVIVIADESLPYYPTMAQFVSARVLDQMTSVGESESKITDKAFALAFEHLEAGGAADIYWHLRAMRNPDQTVIRAYYDSIKGNPNSDIALLRWVEMCNLEDFAIREQCLFAVEDFLKRFDNSPCYSQLKGLKDNLEIGILRVDYPNMCVPGAPVKVAIKSWKVDTAQILAYKVAANQYDSWRRLDPAKTKPAAVADYKATDPRCNIHNDTIEMVITTPGYYIFTTKVGDAYKDLKNTYNPTICAPFVPMIVNWATAPYVLTINPITSQPVSGVKVKGRDNKLLGVTNENGCAKLSKVSRTTRPTYVYQGLEYDFDGYITSKNDDYNPKNRPEATIITDRNIYRPGDTIQWSTVVVESVGDIKNPATHVVANRSLKIVFNDANGTQISVSDVTTNDWGQSDGFFVVPDDGRMAGNYSIEAILTTTAKASANQYIGSRFVMVSDFKIPKFQIKMQPEKRGVPNIDSVTLCGDVVTFTDMPVASASVQISVYTAPNRWFGLPVEIVGNYETVTDTLGHFDVVVDIPHSRKANYTYTVTATSQDGESNTAQGALSFGRPFSISLSNNSYTINVLNPVSLGAKVLNADNVVQNVPLDYVLERKTDNKTYKARIKSDMDWSNIAPGHYTLSVFTRDPALADTLSVDVIAYNPQMSVLPDNNPLFIPETRLTVSQSTDTIPVTVGVATDDTYIYILECNGPDVNPRAIKLDKGYHTIQCYLPYTSGCDAKIIVACAKDMIIYEHTIDVVRTQESDFKIMAENFRNFIAPGSQVTWRFKVQGSQVRGQQAAMLLDMYNSALNKIQNRGIISLSRPVVRQNSSVWLWTPNIGNGNLVYRLRISQYDFPQIIAPEFNTYGMSLFDVPVFFSGRMKQRAMGTVAMPMADFNGVSDAMLMSSAGVEESATTDASLVDIEEEKAADIDWSNLRSDYIPVALWRPFVKSDTTGCVEVSFTMPNANASWSLQVLAWNVEGLSDTWLTEIVSNKPVMISPNLPRYVRIGDIVSLPATIYNNTDSVVRVETTAQVYNPLTGDVLQQKTFNNSLSPKGFAVVAMDIEVPEDVPGLAVRMITRTPEFSDGEQSLLPVLPNEQRTIDTTPFYLATDQSEYQITLPKGKNTNITLNYVANPSWTVVSALPGLRNLEPKTPFAIVSKWYSAYASRAILKQNPSVGKAIDTWTKNEQDSVLVSKLQKNEDLKVLSLNATPWVAAAESETQRMHSLALLLDSKTVNADITSTLSLLKKSQLPSGGWKWGDWSEKASPWVTMQILKTLGEGLSLDDKNSGEIKAMATKAFDFIDKEIEPKYPDVSYVYIRTLYPDIKSSDTARKITNITIQDIIKGWKNYDVSTKAIAAIVLYHNGYKPLSSQILQSIEQFAVSSPERGAYFPSQNTLAARGNALRAFAMLQPQSAMVDALRQNLIVEKQAQNWGNSNQTTSLIAAFLSCGSDWNAVDNSFTIKVDNQTILPDALSALTGEFNLNLSAFAGGRLSIERTAGAPAYGAVFAQQTRPMDKIAAHSCDDISIQKQLYVMADGRWKDAPTTLKTGDRVKVQLTVKVNRNLQYVTIVDERPATFAPVNQLPGWEYMDGVGLYRQNNDESTIYSVSYMPKGTYLLTYEMFVNNAGVFSSGIATVQSQYAPEITAHSAGNIIRVK